jgi:hypothetical protein
LWQKTTVYYDIDKDYDYEVRKMMVLLMIWTITITVSDDDDDNVVDFDICDMPILRVIWMMKV